MKTLSLFAIVELFYLLVVRLALFTVSIVFIFFSTLFAWNLFKQCIEPVRNNRAHVA